MTMLTCPVGGGKRTGLVVHRGVAVNLKKARGLSESPRGTCDQTSVEEKDGKLRAKAL